MESIIIKEGRPLKGTINISGSKNASLPILASSILVQKLELNNIPFLEDVKSMLFLLNSLGIDFKFTKKGTTNTVLLKLSDKNFFSC